MLAYSTNKRALVSEIGSCGYLDIFQAVWKILMYLRKLLQFIMAQWALLRIYCVADMEQGL